MLVSEDEDEDSDIFASQKHIKNLNRWDMISVGAFRKTRESLGDVSTPGTKDYGHVMRSSPLNAMWNNSNQRGGSKPGGLSVFHSPLLSPAHVDGEVTPTHHGQHALGRRESYRDQKQKKMKRKNFNGGQEYHHHSHQHQHSPQHRHHPNYKLRSVSSTQRVQNAGVASSPVPPLTI
jgi:hypothetical protein